MWEWLCKIPRVAINQPRVPRIWRLPAVIVALETPAKRANKSTKPGQNAQRPPYVGSPILGYHFCVTSIALPFYRFKFTFLSIDTYLYIHSGKCRKSQINSMLLTNKCLMSSEVLNLKKFKPWGNFLSWCSPLLVVKENLCLTVLTTFYSPKYVTINPFRWHCGKVLLTKFAIPDAEI